MAIQKLTAEEAVELIYKLKTSHDDVFAAALSLLKQNAILGLAYFTALKSLQRDPQEFYLMVKKQLESEGKLTTEALEARFAEMFDMNKEIIFPDVPEGQIN